MNPTENFIRSKWRTWMLIILVAIGPFLLRTGLNLEGVQRQAVLQVYRNLRFSDLFRDIPQGSTLIFERQNEKSLLEDAFKSQLQRDFKLAEIGDAPRVRILFDSSTFLSARVDLEMPAKKGYWQSWNYTVRFVNNGLLLGMWIGLLVWVYLNRFKLAAGISIASMILWQVDWNPLEAPGYLIVSIKDFLHEIILRFQSGNWTATEYGRLIELGAFLWFIFGLLGFMFFAKKRGPKALLPVFILGFVFEPLMLWTSSRFAQWGLEASWWKIYLGSFVYRFLLAAHCLYAFLRPGYVKFSDSIENPQLKKEQYSWFFFVIPLVFVLCGGWSWIQSIFAVDSSMTLLRLKLFFAGLIVSFVLGSRIFSLWIGSMAFSVIFPPTQGHWMASAAYGLLMDGLLLGWFVTPYKGRIPVLALSPSARAEFFIVTAMAWVIGVFLSGIGAPVAISWATLCVSVWGYAHLSGHTGGAAHSESLPDFDGNAS